jgi:hypothetical protein
LLLEVEVVVEPNLLAMIQVDQEVVLVDLDVLN